MAAIAEEMLDADEEALTRLVREKPGVAQRIAETIKRAIDRFRGEKNAEPSSGRHGPKLAKLMMFSLHVLILTGIRRKSMIDIGGRAYMM